MKRRIATEEERALFKAAMGEGPAPEKDVAAPVPAQTPAAKPRKPGTTGIDGGTQERLRRGLIEPDARLDLHGLTESAAHRTLLTFVKGAQARGCRLVLVITGKGAGKRAGDFGDRTAGVLKQEVPRWLAEPGFAELIAETRLAHRRHGGEGARYVYLRKAKR